MVPSSSAAAGLGAEQPAGLQRTESAQATTAAPAAEQAGSSPGPVRTVCALINSGEQPALATAAAAAAGQAAPAAGQAPPARDPSMLVQSGAEPAEADSANQQQPPPDAAQSASAKITDALTAVPAAMVGMRSQQGPAEFQEGAQRGPRGAAVACSEPCTGLSAASQDGASSAASAADATQGGVLVAQGSQEADGHDGFPTAASKVRHWTGCSPQRALCSGTEPCSAAQSSTPGSWGSWLALRAPSQPLQECKSPGQRGRLQCNAAPHYALIACRPGQTAAHSHLLQCLSSLRAATFAAVQCNASLSGFDGCRTARLIAQL